MKKSNLIADGSLLKLTAVRLSGNPNAQVIDDAQGVAGKFNVTESGRKYYLAEFGDIDNPFAAKRTRAMFSNEDGTWSTATPTELKSFIGKSIPGEMVSREVEAYEAGEGDNMRSVTKYTVAVLRGESISTVFKSAGHELPEEAVDAPKTPKPSEEGNL